ncbi:MAG: hypothetical protein SGPRY_001312 [Prymnesium sp.]
MLFPLVHPQPHQLPLRYTYTAGNTADFELELHVLQICNDDNSCWAEHANLCSIARELHEQAQISMTRHELATSQLSMEEARAFSLSAAAPHETAGASRGVELARVGCHVHYLARRFGVRCGLKQLGERSKRHVHTVGGCVLRPKSCILALASHAQGDLGLLDSLTASLICNLAKAKEKGGLPSSQSAVEGKL